MSITESQVRQMVGEALARVRGGADVDTVVRRSVEQATALLGASLADIQAGIDRLDADTHRLALEHERRSQDEAAATTRLLLRDIGLTPRETAPPAALSDPLPKDETALKRLLLADVGVQPGETTRPTRPEPSAFTRSLSDPQRALVAELLSMVED